MTLALMVVVVGVCAVVLIGQTIRADLAWRACPACGQQTRSKTYCAYCGCWWGA